MDHVTHYREHGWVVVPEVFSRARVARIAEIAGQVSQLELSSNPATPMTTDASPAGQLAPRKSTGRSPSTPSSAPSSSTATCSR